MMLFLTPKVGTELYCPDVKTILNRPKVGKELYWPDESLIDGRAETGVTLVSEE
jgi:hypothetical protein